MPQDPFAGLPDKGSDPFAGLPDITEPTRTPDQMNDLERQVIGLPPNQPELSWYDPDYWIPMALRTVPAIGGGILGGTAGSIVPGAGTLGGAALGGAGGSFLGENLAQGYEMLRGVREHYNPYSVAVNTGLGAIPGIGKTPGINAGAKELIKYAVKAPVMGAVEGGVLGGASTIPQQWAETGELPTLGQVGTGAAVGAGIGAATGGAMGSYPAVKRARATRPIPPVAAPIDLPLNVQLPNEFAPIDAPTAAPTPVVHPPQPTVVKAPVNPLRPEVPPGQLTNREMSDVLTTRAAQETPPASPEAPPVPHEFAPVPEEGVPFDLENPDINDFFIRDAERMKRERENAPFNQERADATDQWNRSQQRNAIYEGRNINDIHTPLDERQLQVKAANDRVREFSDKHAEWFSEQESKLPEDQFFQEPPESKAAFDAEYARLQEERNALVERLYPEELKALADRPEDIVVQASKPTQQLDTSLPPEEVQFVDPNTGEIKPASQAKPGDVLLPKSESNTGQSNVPPVQPPSRNSRRFGLAGVEQGQGGGRPPRPPENPPFDTSGYVPPEGTPPIRDPRLAGARQLELPGTAQPQPAQFPENYSRPFEPTGPMPVRQPEIPGTQQQQPRFDTGAPPQPIPQKMKQPTFQGIEPQRPKGLVTEDKLKPNVPVRRRKPQRVHEQTLLGKIWDTPRSLQSIDAPGITSAALRQSRPLAFTPDWFKAWIEAAKSFRNKNDMHQAMQDAIKENPYFKPQYEAQYNKRGELTHYVEKPSIAEKAGLLMSDVLNNREDAIRSSLAEKIPGYGRYVKASNRAYTSFLNHLRVTKFEQLMDAAILQGRGNDEVLQKKIADFVNNATGRGRLKFGSGKYSLDLEPLADELGHALYSPRALAARLAFMNPFNYTTADPLVRNEYWKGLARMVASWAAFAGLGKFALGGDVSTDFSSSDAGKIKFGNRRYDPGAGWLQLMHLVGKEYYGGSTTTTPPAGQKPKFTPFGDNPVSGDMWTPLQRYLKNQLNPATGYVVDLLTAARGGKEPFDVTDRTLQLIAPMFLDDIAQAAQEDSTVHEVFGGILGSAGLGGQTYDKGGFGKPTLTPVIEDWTGWEPPTTVLGGKKK